jgi:protein-S-isoprenylcysteine O-methyltransferase Ste14
MAMRKTIQALAYGILWALVAPLLLWWWSHRIPLALPGLHIPMVGGLLLATGLTIWLAGVSRLRSEGGGLPMNAFPPPRLAMGGVYGLVPHPIYTGFALAWSGFALWMGSAHALWVGTPVLILVCLSLVWGYERPDLARRFGPTNSPRPWIGFVAAGESELSFYERFGAMLAGTLPWLISYAWVKQMGAYPDAVETRMAWEWNIPILGWTTLAYSSPYLLVPLAFLVTKERASMRGFLVRAWLCTGIATLIYLCLPLTAAFRPPLPGLLAQWIELEQLAARPAVASWPSFHVIWTLLVAQALAGQAPIWLRYGWALAVSVTCLTTGMHSVSDLAAAVLLWWVLRDPAGLWRRILTLSERLSNAWRSWHFGPVRVISHGVWSGLAGGTGLLVVVSATGSSNVAAALLVFVCGLVCAALWAQAVEGSSMLSRPFGYFGAVLGGALGVVLVGIMGGNWALLAGAFAVAAAPMQALGRLRCLEQGCCHGHPVSWGIKVFNSHSRVTAMGALRGVPIHPTQLYSILGNIVSGMLLARLWALAVPVTVVAGFYLMSAGVLRFVEEAYRGEPQTFRTAGLSLYQWLALVSFLGGMGVCLIPAAAAPGFSLPGLGNWGYALFAGLVCAAAMSVDCPKATWRFSRLTG